MSLMDNVPVESTEQVTNESVNSNSPETQAIQNDVWYFDENTPGAGEKPEWLQSTKYKSVAEQAKAYNEAQKRLGAFKGAPEEYEIKVDDPDVKVNKDDPLIKEFLADAKANNVSQDYVNQLLKTYTKALKYGRPDPKKELEALGPNAAQDLNNLNKWASNNLSTDELNTFKNMMQTADSVRLMQKLKGLANRAPTQPQSSQAPTVSKESILKKVHDPRYKTDEQFRKQVRQELEMTM